jgi:hypothetical protein
MFLTNCFGYDISDDICNRLSVTESCINKFDQLISYRADLASQPGSDTPAKRHRTIPQAAKTYVATEIIASQLTSDCR